MNDASNPKPRYIAIVNGEAVGPWSSLRDMAEALIDADDFDEAWRLDVFRGDRRDTALTAEFFDLRREFEQDRRSAQADDLVYRRAAL